MADDFYSHLRLAAERQILEDRQRALETRLQDVKVLLANEEARKAEIDAVSAELDRSVEQTTDATSRAVDDLFRLLGSTRGSRPARDALDAWSRAHRFLTWDLYFSGGPDGRAPLRSELQTAVARMNEPCAEQLAQLLRRADDEEQSRRRRWEYHHEAQAIDTRALQAERDRLINALVEPSRRIQELEVQLSSRDLAAMSPDEVALLRDSESLRAQYLDLQTRLEAAGLDELSLELDQTHIARETWCRLFVHGGIAALIVQGDGATEQLRSAISTYGGPCQEFAAEQLDVATIHAAWTTAMFLEAQEDPAFLILDETGGRWVVDGTRIEGTGPTRVRLAAGTHRIELASAGGGDAILEDFKQGDIVGIRAEDGHIELDMLLPTDDAWEIPVRRQVFLVPEEPRRWPAPRWSVAAGPTTLLFDGRLHIGGTVSSQYVWLSRPSLELSAGLAFDWLGSEHAYSYGVGSTSALLRLRAPVHLSFASARLQPMLSLSPGVILPFQALCLDAATGLALRLDPQTSLLGEVGSTSSFWARGATWMEPTASLSLARWF